MSTCFLKRFVPFLLTLFVGVGLGSLFQTERAPSQFTTRTYSESRQNYVFAPRDAGASSAPLAILFEPSTHMTEAARRHQTYGVVQLLVEYGANGKARVLERITTLPDGLTEEAVEAAEQTQFRPATINGQPVTQTRVQAFYFDMARY
ncbi:MAG: hypothetical protein QOF02_612 [Blastocatellia bacterium]|nr:hypothetical protein [Blastocatellia bacterium]